MWKAIFWTRYGQSTTNSQQRLSAQDMDGAGLSQLLAAGEENRILGVSIYKHPCHVNSPIFPPP